MRGSRQIFRAGFSLLAILRKLEYNEKKARIPSPADGRGGRVVRKEYGPETDDGSELAEEYPAPGDYTAPGDADEPEEPEEYVVHEDEYN